eukprot:COSAG01_NODE_7493_length_3185_cov_101.246598_3_plen_69_part_00
MYALGLRTGTGTAVPVPYRTAVLVRVPAAVPVRYRTGTVRYCSTNLVLLVLDLVLDLSIAVPVLARSS